MEIGRVYKRIGGEFYKKKKIKQHNRKKTIKIRYFKHFFVCVEKEGEHFAGVMITHNSTLQNNIMFSPEHILKGYEFKYDNSCFMAQYLLKDIGDNCLVDCGGLTIDGLAYVKERSCHDTITWKEYEKKRIMRRCGRYLRK